MIIKCKNNDCCLSKNGFCTSNELNLIRDKDNKNCNILICLSHEWSEDKINYKTIEPKIM